MLIEVERTARSFLHLRISHIVESHEAGSVASARLDTRKKLRREAVNIGERTIRKPMYSRDTTHS